MKTAQISTELSVKDFQNERDNLARKILLLIHEFESKFTTTFVDGVRLTHSEILSSEGSPKITKFVEVVVKV
jgi:ribosomal protein S3AE